MDCRVSTPKSIEFRYKLGFTKTKTKRQRQKALEKELSCEFIRINSDEKGSNIFKAINEIHRSIKKSTKK